MCAEGRSRDVCLARTVREWAGLRRGWEARLQNRGLQVRFLPGLFVGQALSSFTVRRHLVSWVYIGSRTNDNFLGGLGGLATHTRRTTMNETTPWPLKYVPKNLDEAALTPELQAHGHSELGAQRHQSHDRHEDRRSQHREHLPPLPHRERSGHARRRG